MRHRFWVERDIRAHGIKLTIAQEETSGVRKFWTEVTCKSERDMEDSVVPSQLFDWESATELMNELWNAGIRPSEVGTPGEKKALQDRIKAQDDEINFLRAIVHHNLGMT